MEHLGGVRESHQTASYLERNLRHWDDFGFGLWVLRESTAGEAAGLGMLRHVTLDTGDDVEVGYALIPRLWGRGIATEVAAACLERGRADLGLQTIVALTRPGNLASHRVLRKVGLELEREVVVDGVPNLLFRTTLVPRFEP